MRRLVTTLVCCLALTACQDNSAEEKTETPVRGLKTILIEEFYFV